MNVPRFQRFPIDTAVYNNSLRITSKIIDRDLVGRIRKIIIDTIGADPYMDPAYRGQKFVKARQLFMHFITVYANYSYADAAYLVGKDHASVNHANKCIEKYINSELEYKLAYDTIERKIKEAVSKYKSN